MNRAYDRRIAIGLAVLSLIALTGCGSSQNNLPPPGYIPQPVGPGYGTPGTCVPVSQQIGFTGSGIYFDSASIRAGALPDAPNGATGMLAVTFGGSGGNYNRVNPYTMAPVPGADGQISMNITPVGNNGGVYWGAGGTTAAMNGVLTIRPETQQEIFARFGQGACVSGIAIDSGHNNTMLYNIRVFLYLNNTNHGQILYP